MAPQIDYLRGRTAARGYPWSTAGKPHCTPAGTAWDKWPVPRSWPWLTS